MSQAFAPIASPEEATFDRVVEGLRQETGSFLTGLRNAFGDLVVLPFDGRNLYLVSDPELIREMFLGDPGVYKKRRDETAERAYLAGLAGFTPIFEHANIPGLAVTIEDSAARTHLRWQALAGDDVAPEVDIYREMMRATLEVVSEVLFHAHAADEAASLVEAILEMDTGYGFDPVEAVLGDFLPPLDASLPAPAEAARQRLVDFIGRLIAADEEKPSGSFLSMLISSLGPEAAAEVAMSTMFAFHEVTATTLSWAWFLLSEHPEVEHLLLVELAEVLGGRPPSYPDLANLPYTTMVLDEVRRLYPSVWLVARFLRDDVNWKGHHVPAGSIALATAYATHRDPRFFADPDRFDPNRWTDAARAARPEFSYFPFSAGPRRCAGEEFARVEDGLLLATLAQRWQPRLVPGQSFEPRPQKSMAPRPGIRMTLHRRP
jgi:cytochrome P450